MPGEDEFFPKDRNDWRAWLRRNHGKSEGIWLIVNKKHVRGRGIHYGEALEEALCFGWIDSKLRAIDDERYAQRFTPRKRGSPWSAHNKRRALELMEAGRMEKPGLERIEDAKARGLW